MLFADAVRHRRENARQPMGKPLVVRGGASASCFIHGPEGQTWSQANSISSVCDNGKFLAHDSVCIVSRDIYSNGNLR